MTTKAEKLMAEEMCGSMARDEIVAELEARGFACYESERKFDLAVALVQERMLNIALRDCVGKGGFLPDDPRDGS
jgi:hypothetical protein